MSHVQCIDEEPDGEDDLSQAAHVATLKASTDQRVIDDRMKRTFRKRRELVVEGSRVDDVLQQYPPLGNPLQVRKFYFCQAQF